MTEKPTVLAGGGPPSSLPTPPARRETAILAVAFLAGTVLMAMEIVGGRLIAARFGSHVFVWGGLIGVFMGALSLGYFLGGRVADRSPRFLTLGSIMILAGLAILTVPVLGGPVCALVAGLFFTGNAELANRWNPTFAIVLIFTVPSLLLGSVSPFAVRLLARDIATMGRVAARVYAFNAMGSIAGTLVTAFILMGFLGNTAILVFSGIVFSASGGALILWTRSGEAQPLGDQSLAQPKAAS